jgi:hypothetical protein
MPHPISPAASTPERGGGGLLHELEASESGGSQRDDVDHEIAPTGEDRMDTESPSGPAAKEGMHLEDMFDDDDDEEFPALSAPEVKHEEPPT